MTAPASRADEHGRPEPDFSGNELTLLSQFLDYQRATLAWKTAGITDDVVHSAWGGREQVSLRWVLLHMVEEYARHNGHADLLREAVDGQVGE